MNAAMLLAAALAAGYLLGRHRPWTSLSHWAWCQFMLGGAWARGAAPRRWLLAAAFTATHPVASAELLRHHRNSPAHEAVTVVAASPRKDAP